MAAVAPRLAPESRTASAATVVAIHVALVALLLLMPSVRERVIAVEPMFVEYRAEAPAPMPEPPPLPKPVMHEPLTVAVPMPPIAIAPELTIDPPARRAPTIALPTGPAVKQPEPQAPVAPPRFDLAYLDNPAPEYPPLSRRLREQGRVMLRVLVSAQGSAQDVEIGTSSGSERLDRAAVEAVRRWRFEPARRGSQAVAAWALVPVLFQLDT